MGKTTFDFTFREIDDSERYVLKAENVTNPPTEYRIWIGDTFPTSINTKFAVKKDGTMEVAGNIKAGGKVGSFVVGEDSFYNVRKEEFGTPYPNINIDAGTGNITIALFISD